MDSRNVELVESLKRLSDGLENVEAENTQLKDHNKYLELKIQEVEEEVANSQRLLSIQHQDEINRLNAQVKELNEKIMQNNTDMEQFKNTIKFQTETISDL